MADAQDQRPGEGGEAPETEAGIPNPQTGAGIGAGEGTTFEPEEDPEGAEEPE